jgi:hypothetical protein
MKLEKASWIAAILAIPVAFFVWYFKPEDFNSFFKGLGKLIYTPFSMVFNWLTHPVTWPVWALILIAISGLAVVAMLFYFFGKVSETQPVPELLNLDPLNYRADEIFGVEWVWSYVYGKLNVNDLSAFCPKKSCMCRLTMQEHPERMAMRQSGYSAGVYIPVSFTCTTCGFTRQFDSDWKKLKNDIFLEIERRIRTGEFQQRMTQNKV